MKGLADIPMGCAGKVSGTSDVVMYSLGIGPCCGLLIGNKKTGDHYLFHINESNANNSQISEILLDLCPDKKIENLHIEIMESRTHPRQPSLGPIYQKNLSDSLLIKLLEFKDKDLTRNDGDIIQGDINLPQSIKFNRDDLEDLYIDSSKGEFNEVSIFSVRRKLNGDNFAFEMVVLPDLDIDRLYNKVSEKFNLTEEELIMWASTTDKYYNKITAVVLFEVTEEKKEEFFKANKIHEQEDVAKLPRPEAVVEYLDHIAQPIVIVFNNRILLGSEILNQLQNYPELSAKFEEAGIDPREIYSPVVNQSFASEDEEKAQSNPNASAASPFVGPFTERVLSQAQSAPEVRPDNPGASHAEAIQNQKKSGGMGISQ